MEVERSFDVVTSDMEVPDGRRVVEEPADTEALVNRDLSTITHEAANECHCQSQSLDVSYERTYSHSHLTKPYHGLVWSRGVVRQPSLAEVFSDNVEVLLERTQLDAGFEPTTV